MTLFVLITQRAMLLSLKKADAHDGERDRQLENLKPEGLDNPVALRELIRRMIAFDHGQRFSMVELISHIEGLLSDP